MSSIFTILLCVWYILSARQSLAAQADVAKVNFIENATRSLLMDAVEYSKQHPALTPLLQSWNVMPATGASATAPKPAAK